MRFGRPMASPLFVPCRRPCSIPVIARPRVTFRAWRPSARCMRYGADVGLGRGGGDGATGVQDEPASVAEEGDELTRFRFDERRRAERDDGAGVEVADGDGEVLHEVVGEADVRLVVELMKD